MIQHLCAVIRALLKNGCRSNDQRGSMAPTIQRADDRAKDNDDLSWIAQAMLAPRLDQAREHGSRNPKGPKMEPRSSRWHHSPTHIFIPNTMYILTASTVSKQHIFRGEDRLQMLQDALLEVAAAYEWSLQAWAVFSNHDHFVAKSPNDATTLRSGHALRSYRTQ
jgi:hypothetical protein